MLQPNKTLLNANIHPIENNAQLWLMKLDANESYLGPSPKVLKRLERLEAKELSLYPNYEELYEKIADINEVKRENIVLTCGANEALSALIKAYLDEGQTLQTLASASPISQIYAQIIGADYVKIPYEEEWAFPEDSFIQAIDAKTKIIILTTPDSITGSLINPKIIERITTKHPDKLIIVDESYINGKEESSLDMLNKFNNIAIIRSFSTEYGLAGLRIAYILADVKIVENVKKVITPYSISSISAIAACESINDKHYTEFVKKEIETSKQLLTTGLEKLNAKVYKSEANFVLVNFYDKAHDVYNLLKEHNILVKNFFNSNDLKNCLRITIPSVNGTRELLKILTPKDTIVFELDDVLVDVNNSSIETIKQTYENFTGQQLSYSEIQTAKQQGGFGNNWNLTHYLISSTGYYMPYGTIVEEFQKMYWNNGQGLIKNESLIIDKELLKKLAKKYTLAILTSRPKEEVQYTLNKFELEQYFSNIITMNDLPNNNQKPDTLGLDKIKKELCPLNMYYLGSSTDDITCAKNYNIYAIGVLPPLDKSDGLKDHFFVFGADYVINNVNEIETIVNQTEENRQAKSPY